MEKNIVFIEKNEPFVFSTELALGFGLPHRDITDIIKKYLNEFEELGVIAVELQKPSNKKGGRPTENYKLNEGQSIYLGTLLRNWDSARAFKMKLTKQFVAQRKLLAKILSQHQNAEWLEKRASGKIERRLATDVIQEFVEYATSQGSKSADKYYMIITKMENQSLFALDFMGQKFPNLREVLDGFALDVLKMADHAVGLALKTGMNEKLPYKEVYQMAKSRIETFASLMGKTPLRIVLEQKTISK